MRTRLGLMDRWIDRLRQVGSAWRPGARKRRWEALWQVENERPTSDLATTVPLELKDAVAEGWLTPGSTVMDVGAGGGQISAWLVERGFNVVGVDIAEAATHLARRRFGDRGPKLEFRTLNVCHGEAETGRFEGFVDRGCFHSVDDRAGYVRNVATWGAPGARLLLFHAFSKPGSDPPALEQRRQAAVERRVRRAFESRFVVERVAPAAEPLVRSAGRIPRATRRGLVFWMVKR